ncbi:hypothetical protein AtNW77_Chr4g0279651 [Arabidopsis thaliana]
MNSKIERPESPSFDDAGSSNDLCIRPNDIAGPHYQSTCTLHLLIDWESSNGFQPK